MCRSEHHHHTNNARKHRTRENVTPPTTTQTRRGSERSRHKLRHRSQHCATPKTQPTTSLNSNLNSSTMGLSLSSHTQDHRSLCSDGASAETPITAPLQTLILATLRGGLDHDARASWSAFGRTLQHRYPSRAHPRVRACYSVIGRATNPSSVHAEASRGRTALPTLEARWCSVRRRTSCY
jgi:hypothetical protein